VLLSIDPNDQTLHSTYSCPVEEAEDDCIVIVVVMKMMMMLQASTMTCHYKSSGRSVNRLSHRYGIYIIGTRGNNMGLYR
jgi:hypothetical protein